MSLVSPVFQKTGPPTGKRLINIPEKAKKSLELKDLELCILPSKGEKYFVYSGEAKNIKSRVQAHVAGYSGTGCLALAKYPDFNKYKWWFHYAVCDFGDKPNDSKLLRTVGEQLWRAKYGWPILCGK